MGQKYIDIEQKVENIITTWSKRTVTLQLEIPVIKPFALLQFVLFMGQQNSPGLFGEHIK